MKQDVLTVVQETVILGKKIQMYGNIDNPLFRAVDVADWIEHSKVSVMLKTVESDEKVKVNNVYSENRTGGNGTWFITEDGLYEVCMQSRKPIAKQIKKEIKAYLKQIRKTGGYIPVSNQDDDLTIMARAHQILERTIAQKDQIIQQLKPKADTYDMIMDSDGTFSMNQVAKQVGMGEYHLFAYLRGKKVLFYEGSDNVPYERFRKNGCFKVIDTVSPDGKSHSTTRVTQKGLDYICKIIRKDNEEVAWWLKKLIIW